MVKPIRAIRPRGDIMSEMPFNVPSPSSDPGNPFLRTYAPSNQPMPDIAAESPGLVSAPAEAGTDGVRLADLPRAARPVAVPDAGPVHAERLPRRFRGRHAAAAAVGWCAVDVPRVVVWSAGGGVGVSTVAAVLGDFVAAVRSGAVLLDLGRKPWTNAATAVLGGGRGSDGADLLHHAYELDATMSLIPRSAEGLRVVDQVRPDRVGVIQSVLPAGPAVLLDAGELRPEIAGAVLEQVDRVVVVARADNAGMNQALVIVSWLRSTFPEAPAARHPVIVSNDCGGFAGAEIRSAARRAEQQAVVVSIPLSPALRAHPVRLDRLESPTATAVAALAYAVLTSGGHPATDTTTQEGSP